MNGILVILLRISFINAHTSDNVLIFHLSACMYFTFLKLFFLVGYLTLCVISRYYKHILNLPRPQKSNSVFIRVFIILSPTSPKDWSFNVAIGQFTHLRLTFVESGHR
jgi:hypothetical protein